MEKEETTLDPMTEADSASADAEDQQVIPIVKNHSELRRMDDNNMLWIKAQALNSHLVCGLCQGYLHEACTITECMHSCKYIY